MVGEVRSRLECPLQFSTMLACHERGRGRGRGAHCGVFGAIHGGSWHGLEGVHWNFIERTILADVSFTSVGFVFPNSEFRLRCPLLRSTWCRVS